VMAALALFIALGGLSWAALTLPKKSVGTAQLKKNAVTTKKVKNRTLRRKDFRSGVLLQGPQGPPGPANPVTGAAGGDLTGLYPDPTIAAGAIGGAEVAANSLSGSDIDESTLDGGNAATLGGIGLGGLAGIGRHDTGVCSDNEHDAVECARVAEVLPRAQRVLLVATGTMQPLIYDDNSGPGSGSDIASSVDGQCSLSVDNAPVPGAQSRTSQHSNSGPGYVPFAITTVTDVLSAELHTFSIDCLEFDGSMQWILVNISAVAVAAD